LEHVALHQAVAFQLLRTEALGASIARSLTRLQPAGGEMGAAVRILETLAIDGAMRIPLSSARA
jgi:hypothetical protein